MTEFFLLKPKYEIKSLEFLRSQWSNIANERIRNAIVIEQQYLDFHVNFLLRQLCYRLNNEEGQLDYPARVGFVRTAAHLYLSIAKRALSVYVQQFGFDFSLGEPSRSLNHLLSICQSFSPLKVEPIVDDLRFLQEMSNTGNGYNLVQEEQRIMITGNIVLTHLQSLHFSEDDSFCAA